MVSVPAVANSDADRLSCSVVALTYVVDWVVPLSCGAEVGTNPVPVRVMVVALPRAIVVGEMEVSVGAGLSTWNVTVVDSTASGFITAMVMVSPTVKSDAGMTADTEVELI